MGSLFKLALLAAIILPPLDGVQYLFTQSSLIQAGFSRIVPHNFRIVSSGEFYRSGEMSLDDLDETLRAYRIRTLIDLRWSPRTAPEENEELVARRHGVFYVRAPMRSTRVPDREALEILLQSYRDLPKPILVHCRDGVHRTGVASVLWLLDQKGTDIETAEQQLTAQYGFWRGETFIRRWKHGHEPIEGLISQYKEFNSKHPISIARFIRTSVSAEKHEVFPENEPYMPLEAQIYRSVLRLGTTGDSTTPWLFLPGVIAIL